MAIEAYTGTPGCGKSYALTSHGLNALRHGIPVYANYRFLDEQVYRLLRRRWSFTHREACASVLNIHELHTFEDLVGIHDAVLLFDEAHDWLNSRSYSLIPHEIISWWSQHRHAGVQCYMASQRFGSIDAHVRSLVAHVYLCRPMPWHVNLVMNLGRIARRRARRPYLRVTEMFDETSGNLGGVSSNIFSSVSRNTFLALDYEVASCYDTRGGVFPSPLHAMEAKRNEFRKEIGDLEFAFKKYLKRRGSSTSDGMPSLSFREFAEAAVAGHRVDASSCWSDGWIEDEDVDVAAIRAEVEAAFRSVEDVPLNDVTEYDRTDDDPFSSSGLPEISVSVLG